MTNNKDNTANYIKIAAVTTAAPRWIGALLASEGLGVLESWTWWIWLSALSALGMAIVEGWGLSYVLTAWRNQNDKKSNLLFWFAMVTGGIMVIVVSPYIAAQVRGQALSDVLASDWSLWLWSAAVGASTIAIVASVGFAEKQTASRKQAKVKQVKAKAPSFPCSLCDYEAKTQQALNGHQAKHKQATAADGGEGKE